jgi:hypothetical protein
MEWGKCLGGSCIEVAYQLELTPDGGYICIGYSCSKDGNVTENYGNYDVWVLKLNQMGDIEWQHSFGGTYTDWGLCIHTTTDGGSIIGGLVNSTDGNIHGNYHEKDDAWIAKLDSSGNIMWQKIFGGTESESVISIMPTNDAGYIFSGHTSSNDGDVSGNHGNDDVWVVKLDHEGNLIWQKCYGGSLGESGLVIRESSDGNYFVGGYTHSSDGQVIGNHSSIPYNADMWILKISPSGNLIWQQCVGGVGDEGVNDLMTYSEGKLEIIGWTTTDDNSGDVNCEHHGYSTSDVWFVQAKDSSFVGINVQNYDTAGMVIFPNPANQCMHFITPIQSRVSETFIEIFNNLGQLQDVLKINKLESGILFDCHTFPAGVYYYIYRNNQIQKAGKILIIH